LVNKWFFICLEWEGKRFISLPQSFHMMWHYINTLINKWLNVAFCPSSCGSCFFIPTFLLAYGSSHIQQSSVHWPRDVGFQSGELIPSRASNCVILESSNLVTLCRWLSSIVPTCYIGRAALFSLWLGSLAAVKWPACCTLDEIHPWNSVQMDTKLKISTLCNGLNNSH
jgi:hypothetical protein